MKCLFFLMIAFLPAILTEARAAASAEEIIATFSGNLRDISRKLEEEAAAGEHSLFRDLSRSATYEEIDLFTNELLIGNSSAAKLALLQGFQKNKADYANFVASVAAKARANPAVMAKISTALAQIHAELKAKKIPFPTPNRCATWVLAYAGIRSFFYSFRPMAIDVEDEAQSSLFQPIAENGSNLALMGMGFTCVMEFIVHRNALPRALRAWNIKAQSKAQLKDLTRLVDGLKEDPKLLEQAKKLSALRKLDDLKKFALLENARQKAANALPTRIERESSLPFFRDEMIRAYAAEGRMRKLFEKFVTSLSPAALDQLGMQWRRDPTHPGTQARLELERFQEWTQRDFSQWLSQQPKNKNSELVQELLRQQTEVQPGLVRKAFAQPLTAKACMAMLATGVGVIGYLASAGRDPNPIDRPEDTWFKKHFEEIWLATTWIGTGTCILHVAVSPFHRMHLKKILAQPAYGLNPEDWKELRRLAIAAKKDPTLAPGTVSAGFRELYKTEEPLAQDLIVRAMKRANEVPEARSACPGIFTRLR